MQNLINAVQKLFISGYAVDVDNSNITVKNNSNGRFATIYPKSFKSTGWGTSHYCFDGDKVITPPRGGKGTFYTVGTDINTSMGYDFRKLRKALKAVKDYIDNVN